MTEILPTLALSVRQPWAWAIIHAGKNIENRTKGFFGMKPHSSYCRPIAIHASSGMTRAEYLEGADFMVTLGIKCPVPADLIRGAIIGAVTVTSILNKSHSPWFFGPFGLVLSMPTRCDPIPSKGLARLLHVGAIRRRSDAASQVDDAESRGAAMTNTLKIDWIDSGREPQCPPNTRVSQRPRRRQRVAARRAPASPSSALPGAALRLLPGRMRDLRLPRNHHHRRPTG